MSKAVTCVRLADGQVSVRVWDHEVVILPARRKCAIEDIELAFNTVVDEVEGGEW